MGNKEEVVSRSMAGLSVAMCNWLGRMVSLCNWKIVPYAPTGKKAKVER
jgi:hypothetical protein